MNAFLRAKIFLRDGNVYELDYDTRWDEQVYEDKDFNPSQKFLDGLQSGEDLIEAMQKWFLDALDDTDYARECVEDYGSARAIRALQRKDMQKLEISSLLDCEYAGYGSDITYDFETKKRKRKNKGW